MPEELDYAPRIVLPTEGELSPSEINQLISTATTLRKIDMESRAAARRYRGQQQLQQLIQQGVPMEKAMMQVSPDLFFQEPSGFASFAVSMSRAKQAADRAIAMDAFRRQQMENLEAHRRAIERGKADVIPTVTGIPNPVTGKTIPIIQGGGRWQVAPQDQTSVQDKALKTIADESLKVQQKDLEERLLTAKEPARVKELTDKLLKVKTDRTNLVMGATSPVPTASSKDVRFKSDEEEQSWYNAKAAIGQGRNRTKVIEKMKQAGFTTEGL